MPSPRHWIQIQLCVGRPTKNKRTLCKYCGTDISQPKRMNRHLANNCASAPGTAKQAAEQGISGPKSCWSRCRRRFIEEARAKRARNHLFDEVDLVDNYSGQGISTGPISAVEYVAALADAVFIVVASVGLSYRSKVQRKNAERFQGNIRWKLLQQELYAECVFMSGLPLSDFDAER